MDFIVEVHTTWGEETKFLIKGCSSSDDARSQLVEHYKNHRRVDLHPCIPPPTKRDVGFYIFGVDEVKDKITEVHDYYPPEE
jgi:hypothetical protein